ncbi:MAG TPA: DUF2911 domain-containing protein [Acidobacteriaceae bacterium]|nr:DUF2911 domain-containing protein [Acidobacteriaceae bacterium]
MERAFLKMDVNGLRAAGCMVMVATVLFTASQMTAQSGQEAGGAPGTAAPSANAPMPSPAKTASVEIAGGTIDVRYNSPQMRGRKIMGALVPWNQVWRTGANPATTLITSVPLKFGDLLVPAGTHTIYTLPNPDKWLLIINNQTGQWGTVYNQDQDLGRTPMMKKSLSSPQEGMSISFENTTANSTEMHVRWEMTDVYLPVTKP